MSVQVKKVCIVLVLVAVLVLSCHYLLTQSVPHRYSGERDTALYEGLRLRLGQQIQPLQEDAGSGSVRYNIIISYCTSVRYNIIISYCTIPQSWR